MINSKRLRRLRGLKRLLKEIMNRYRIEYYRGFGSYYIFGKERGRIYFDWIASSEITYIKSGNKKRLGSWERKKVEEIGELLKRYRII